jgi:hypothetical protein
MLDFRILLGAVLFAVTFMAVVLFWFDDRDVSIAVLPRPTVEIAAAPRIEPLALPSSTIVIPKPIFPPSEITGSIDPSGGSVKEIASPPRERPRVEARKKDREEIFVFPFQLFFRFLADANRNREVQAT